MEDLTYCSLFHVPENKSQLRTSKGFSPCFLHMRENVQFQKMNLPFFNRCVVLLID
jgi:hypothetical protein